jgi:hypothetical protein
MRVIKLFPQKRHRCTASRSSCTTQPRPVARRFSVAESSSVLESSAGLRSASIPGMNSLSLSNGRRYDAVGRNAFRAQPRQVRTIVVERINDVTEQRADTRREREMCPSRVQETSEHQRKRVQVRCRESLTPSMSIRTCSCSNIFKRNFHTASRTLLL